MGSTGTNGVWVKWVNLHRGAALLTEIQIFTDNIEYR